MRNELCKLLTIVYLSSLGRSNGYIARKYNISVGRVQQVLDMKEKVRERVNEELIHKYMINIEKHMSL